MGEILTENKKPIIQRVGEVIWIHSEGRTFSIVSTKSSSGSRKTSRSVLASDGVLVAPMPGKILKINFKNGDQVKAGETVCVLEAMKMEYALKSPFDGKLLKLFKKAGDLVVLDEKIAEVGS